MKYLISLLFIAVAGNAETPIIVESLSDGNKATIYIPPGIKLEPGDMLYRKSEKKDEPPKEKTTVVETDKIEEPKPLRPRHHIMSFKASKGDSKLDISTLNIDSKSKDLDIDISYARNFGHLQAGISYIYGKDESDTSTGISTVIVAELRVNFIENAPGNNLIPFAAIAFGQQKYDYKNNSGSDYLLSGEVLGYGAGIVWFPFDEIMGVEVAVGKSEGDLGYSGEPVFSGNIKVERTFFSIGYVFAF